MTISKEIHVHAGHVVSSQVDKDGKPGKCSQMAHGHTYRVIATVDGNIREDNRPNGGMVIDFGDLKTILEDVVYAEADHAFYIWKNDSAIEAMKSFASSKDKNAAKLHITEFVPTAEHLAEHWFNKLAGPLAVVGITLIRLDVWETPTSCATWVGPGRPSNPRFCV